MHMQPSVQAKVDHAEPLVSSAVAKLKIIHYPDLRRPAAACQTATHVRVWGSNEMLHCYPVIIRVTPPGHSGSMVQSENRSNGSL